MTGWSVMLRGIRYRSGRSFMVLVLAAMATLAAVLVPAYGRAAQQSVLTDGLRAAPATSIALVVGTEGSAESAAAAHQPVDETLSVINAALAQSPAVKAVLDKPVTSVDAEAIAGRPGAAAYPTRLAWRQGACSQVNINGQCPTNPGEAVLSERSAKALGVPVGESITVRSGQSTGAGKTFKIVGLYQPKQPNDAYWGNNGYFAYAESAGEAARLDAVFVGEEDDARLDDTAVVTLRVAYPLHTDAVKLDDVPALRTQFNQLTAKLNSGELQLDTALLSILDSVARDQAALEKTVPLIAIPLLLLAWTVLFLLVATLMEERGPELALARLRGYPQGRARRFGLGESMVLIVLGAPFGLLAGIALVELTARLVLARGTHVELRWQILAAVGVGLVLALFAAWLAARRTVRSGVLALLRKVPARTTWQAGVLEGVAFAVAVVAVIAAWRDRGSSLALLAPAAIALAAGIVAGRLLVLWARLRLAMARRSGRLASMLASAQLARGSGAARTVVVLTSAVALLFFSAAAWDVASSARQRHADNTLGSETVFSVTAGHPQALIEAVTAADPGGHAMAVVRTNEQYGSGKVELIGVQSEFLGNVVNWPGHDRAAVDQVSAKLLANAGAPGVIKTDVAVQVVAEGLGETPVRLGVVLSVPGMAPTTKWLGTLLPGQHDYSAELPECAGDCRFVGLALGRAAGGNAPIHASLTVNQISSESTPVAVHFVEKSAWQLATGRTPNAKLKTTAGDKLALVVDSTDPGDVTVSYLDVPARLPVVLSGAAPTDDGSDAFTFPGFADVPTGFSVVQREEVVPRAGAHALLFDLGLATRAASTSAGLSEAGDLRYEVWASADAPADLDRKLSQFGVTLLGTQTMDSELDLLGRRAPALGLRFYLLAGIVAAGLALGVVLLTVRLAGAQRRTELASLRATGVKQPVLRQALRRERWALLAVPLIVGGLVGIGAAVLMLPGIPLVTVDDNAQLKLGELLSALVPGAHLAALPIVLFGALAAAIAIVAQAGRPVRRAVPQPNGGAQ